MSIKDILITGKTAKLPGDFNLNNTTTKAQPVRRHKYGVAARDDRTAQGIVFDSKREMEAFLRLQQAEKAGAIRHLKRQVPFTWEIVYRANGKEYVKREKYVSDFTYVEKVGDVDTFVVLDVKGVRTAVYKRKKRIMLELYGIKIKET